MKILYAIQGTGNGHISRAIALVPILQKYVDVEILISGNQADITLPFPVKYKLHGAGFIFGQNGGVDVWKTFRQTKILRLIKDILSLKLNEYDLIISDFEPISAWAARWRKARCVAMSHQASFYSKKVPRPRIKNTIAEFIMRNYAPGDIKFGFHFDKYDDHIYLPIIRPSIRQAISDRLGHYLVYLPSYSTERIVEVLSSVPHIHWKIYVKGGASNGTLPKNIECFAAGSSSWLKDLSTCDGALIGAGFEGPSELLYLGKKMAVIPMSNQYEQQCNAAALKKIGITVFPRLDTSIIEELKDWTERQPAIHLPYADETEDIVRNLLQEAVKWKNWLEVTA